MTDSFELHLFLGGYRCAADRRNGGRLPASNPDCPKLCQRLLQSGFLYAKEDKLAAGIELYTQAIEIEPDFTEAHFNLGNAYTKQENYDQAVTAYRKGLKINPNHTDALTNLGLVYYKQGKLTDAIQVLEQAVKIDADHEEAKRYLRHLMQRQALER